MKDVILSSTYSFQITIDNVTDENEIFYSIEGLSIMYNYTAHYQGGDNNEDNIISSIKTSPLVFKRPLTNITSGFTKAKREMNLNKKQIAVVGDQIFTDMICGNLSGMFTILVEPFEDEQHGFLRFKRIIQKRLFPERKIEKYDF